MSTKLEKKKCEKHGFPRKLRAAFSGLFSPCGKNVEKNSEENLLDFITTTKFESTSETLVSNLNNHKLEKEHLNDGCYKSEKGVSVTEIKTREKVISKTLLNINHSMQVDLCFVLDCTGSMEHYITAAKDCILNLVDYVKRTNPSIKLWVGLCGYRDHGDGSNRLQIFNFTDSYLDFKNYISKIKAFGGGDIPEDVLGGLNAAVNKMNWCHRTRIILHIGDAPPHGHRFNTTLQDQYPNKEPHGLTAENVLRNIQSKRIFYHFGKITDSTDMMIWVFRSIIGEFLVFDLTTEDKDPESLIEKIFKAVCSSITSSVTLTSTTDSNAHKRQRKELKMDPHEPDWNVLPIQTGKLLHYLLPKTLTDIKDQKYFKGKSNLIIQKFFYKHAPNPFSSGAERYAYFALDVTRGSKEKIVIKESIDLGRKANSLERHLESVEISTIAYFLSMIFNSIAVQKNINKKVNFLKARVLCLDTCLSTQCYTVEPKFHDAEFKRFNVNSGVIKEYHSTLEAFAHFTYEYTEHYLVVYDLQGVELPDQFLLTDAAIHCTDSLRFGKTNLGRRGIEECFLANHKCDIVCQKLGLTKIGRD